jgi:hypothetical protein
LRGAHRGSDGRRARSDLHVPVSGLLGLSGCFRLD